MRPQNVEDLIDAAEVSETSSRVLAPAARNNDTALAAEIADMRSVVTAIAAAMAECQAVAAVVTGNAGATNATTLTTAASTWSPPSSFIIFTATARASIPAYNRRSTFLSSHLVTPMEFAAI